MPDRRVDGLPAAAAIIDRLPSEARAHVVRARERVSLTPYWHHAAHAADPDADDER